MLRDFLVKHGAYIPVDRKRGNETKLLAILKETEIHEWTIEEAIYQIKHCGGFASNFESLYGNSTSSKQSIYGKSQAQPSSFQDPQINLKGEIRPVTESR